MEKYLNTPFSKVKTIHFVGIGGIGMSGLASMFLQLGFTIQGSDVKENPNITALQQLGVKVFIGHSASNIVNADSVVVSSAIKPDNPEVQHANKLGLPIFKRGKMLAELMRYKWSIAVAGTHGKTTTTSLIAHILQTASYDPTAIIGGVVNSWGKNSRYGLSNWLVAETDESDGSFLDLPATISVVTNIEAEHMEHYGNYENLKNHFIKFLHNTPFSGFSVLCTDDKGVQDILPKIVNNQTITYGTSPQADYRVENIRYNKSNTVFDIICTYNNTHKEFKNIVLNMHGHHNVLNCCAAFAVANNINVPEQNIREALANFTGIKRRFSKIGSYKKVVFIDDYGHHPSEIEAVINSANEILDDKGKILAVVQPHRYSRLKDHFNGFAKCVSRAHYVIVLDVYSANETPIPNYNAETLVENMQKYGHKHVIYVNNVNNLPDVVNSIISNDSVEMALFLGAGSISAIAENTLKQLKENDKEMA